MKLPCLVSITLFALATPLFAQDHVLTLGWSNSLGPTVGPLNYSFPLARGKDANRNGVVDSTEIHTFMTKTFGSRAFNTDIRSVVEDGEFTFFISDSENGVIMRARDDNHNGVLDDPEVTMFFDFGPRSPGASEHSPDGLCAYRDTTLNETRVYVAKETDNTNTGGTTFSRGIWRLVDGNGNGNAMDPGEAAPFVTSAMGLQVNDAQGNPVTINADYFEWIRVTATGKVVVWRDGLSIANTAPVGQPPVFPPSQDAFVFYGFTDNAGTAVPEVFANFSSLNTFTQFPDFANATFPNWDTSSVGTSGLAARSYARFFDGTPGGGPNGENMYFFGSSYFGSNVNLNNVSTIGVVYRWLDANNNDVLEVGELDLFGNMSGAALPARNGTTMVPSVTYVDRGAGGATVNTLSLSVYSFTGNDGSAQTWHDLNDCVLTMRDANGNGIIDQGELIQTYYTPQPYTTPFSPAFGPFLENIFAFAVGEMPGPFPTGVEPYGEGCEAPSRGLIPVMDSWNGSPAVGNAAFEVGAIRSVPGIPGIGGPPVFLVASFGQDLTGVSLAPFGLTGCFGWTVMPTTLGLQFTDEHGRAIFATPIPNNGLLTGLALYFQCAIVDPGTTPPRSTFYTTNALKVTIQ